MRILISGAAGFLASHLTDLLLSQGHSVVGLDNFITGKKANIAHLRGRPDYSFFEHDVIQPIDVPGDVDRIYHMASPASPIGLRQAQVATLKVNSQGTWNLLELAERKNARFLMASTSECYGDPAVTRSGGVLGQRQPDRPALDVRRGQAVQRGLHDGLPPRAQGRHPHRPHLQHLRPPHGPVRRAGS
jgi:nucleoside-diphosphate-sugar epimerase